MVAFFFFDFIGWPVKIIHFNIILKGSGNNELPIKASFFPYSVSLKTRKFAGVNIVYPK